MKEVLWRKRRFLADNGGLLRYVRGIGGFGTVIACSAATEIVCALKCMRRCCGFAASDGSEGGNLCEYRFFEVGAW